MWFEVHESGRAAFRHALEQDFTDAAATSQMLRSYDVMQRRLRRSPDSPEVVTPEEVAADLIRAFRGKRIEAKVAAGTRTELSSMFLAAIRANRESFVSGVWVSTLPPLTRKPTPRSVQPTQTTKTRRSKSGRRRSMTNANWKVLPVMGRRLSGIEVWYGEHHDDSENSHKFYCIAVADVYVIRLYGRCEGRINVTVDQHTRGPYAIRALRGLRGAKIAKGYRECAMPQKVRTEMDNAVSARLDTRIVDMAVLTAADPMTRDEVATRPSTRRSPSKERATATKEPEPEVAALRKGRHMEV